MHLLLLLTVLTAKPNPYLAQAKVFFQGGDYKQCLKRIEQAQKWESSLEDQVDVALYSGLCNFQLRKTKEAETDFKLALSLDPNAKLPPLTSPKVASLFESLRPKRDEVAEPPPPPPPQPKPAEPAPEAKLEPRPTEQPPVELREDEPPKRRVPIGGIVLGAVTIGSAIAASFLGLGAQSRDNEARMAQFQSDAAELREEASTSALLANAFWVVTGVAAIAAVILLILGK
jgi:hypothetical protein